MDGDVIGSRVDWLNRRSNHDCTKPHTVVIARYQIEATTSSSRLRKP